MSVETPVLAPECNVLRSMKISVLVHVLQSLEVQLRGPMLGSTHSIRGSSRSAIPILPDSAFLAKDQALFDICGTQRHLE